MKNVSSVDEYMAQFEVSERELLQKLRSIVLAAAPSDTEETISYKMPTYRYNGNLLHFALFKTHIGLYPGTKAIEAFAEELQKYKTSKGAIQLAIGEPLPEELIKSIIAFNVTLLEDKPKPNWATYRDNWVECEAFMNELIAEKPLKKERKWGNDVYTFQGKNVVAWAGFKHFFSVWFYNGVFLTDPYGVLVNASEGKTKALRQWRFTDVSEMDAGKLSAYIDEAIQTIRDGKQIEIEKAEMPTPDAFFAAALGENLALKEAFGRLTPGKQRDYIRHISEAKQDKTKVARLEKITPLILQGQGLHDKYRK